MTVSINLDVGPSVLQEPGANPLAFQQTFCAPLAGGNVLTVNNPNPDLNRPVLPAMCQWIREGWLGLNQGLGLFPGGVPESAVFAPQMVAPEDSGSIVPLWSPRYPFMGPSPYEWTIDERPWPGVDFGLSPPSLGKGVSQSFESLVSGRSYWVRLEDQENVFILVRRALPVLNNGDGVQAPRLGFDPIDAAAVGIGWKLMRDTLMNLRPWWTASVSTGMGSPAIPPGTPVPVILDGGNSLLPLLTRRAMGLASSAAVVGDRDPVFIFEDPFFTGGDASSSAAQRTIRFSAGAVRGSDAPMHQLAWAGLTNWARLRFPSTFFPSPYPLVTQALAMAAGKRLAWAAGTLAHELLHQTWKADLLYNRSWQSTTYPKCWGPQMGVATALRSYRFMAAFAANDSQAVLLDDAVRELDYGQAVRATRHYATYLVGRIIQGLLRNSVGGRLSQQDTSWCASCSEYASLYGC